MSVSVWSVRARLLQLACGLSLLATIFLISQTTQAHEVGSHAGVLLNQLSTYAKVKTASSSINSGEKLRQDKYSIVVSTYARLEHLLAFLDHYGHKKLPNLDAIHIAWGMGAVDPPEELKLDSYNVPVYLERATRNSLTERFRKPKNLRTEAAIWLDDDIQIEAAGLEFAFRAWQEHGKDRHKIVGLSGRQYKTDSKTGVLKYHFFKTSYSMILTNNAFLDTTMLEWFWNDDPRTKAAIEFVDEHMNCEDILMNFVVSEHTGLAPVLVDLYTQTWTVNSFGISNHAGHIAERSLCLQKFVELYGMPLKSTDVTIRQSRPEWKQTMPLPKEFKPIGPPWG